MTRVALVTLAHDEINVYSLAFGDGYLFAGCYSEPYNNDSAIPVKVVKIDPKAMKSVASLTGDVGDIGTRTSIFDNGHLYVGTWTGPGRVLKIDPKTMTKESTLVLSSVLYVNTNETGCVNFPSCFVKDGDDILTGCDMSPARFLRLVDVLKHKPGQK